MKKASLKSNVIMIRAISAEFLARKLKGILIIYFVVAVIGLLICSYLLSLSAWWLFLAVPVIIAAIVGLLTLIIITILVRVLRPTLSAVQRQVINDFVDKLERVADNVQTPVFIIVLKVIKDIIWPAEPTFINQLSTDTTTLRSDFASLRRQFYQ